MTKTISTAGCPFMITTERHPATEVQAASMLFEAGTMILEMEREGLCNKAQADDMLAQVLDFVASCVLERLAQAPNVVAFGKRAN